MKRGKPRRPTKRDRMAIVNDVLAHYPAIPTRCKLCGADWAISVAGLCPECAEAQAAPVDEQGPNV